MRWEPDGVVYEPDRSHAEIVVRELGLETAGTVISPGTRVEHEAGSAPDGVLGLTLEDESEDLEPQDATRFKGFAARCNGLAEDRIDIQQTRTGQVGRPPAAAPAAGPSSGAATA